MKRILLLVAVLVMIGGGMGMAQDAELSSAKFEACENKGSAGFFWVDTTSGMTWLQDPADMNWKYAGKPEGAKTGAKRTYIPFENSSGQGVFILNTATGEGWWTDGVKWKALGKPKEQGSEGAGE